MTNPNLTDITFILDRSGSMEAIKDDTIGGFNAFLAEQKAASGEALMTLVQFDDHYEVVYEGKNIAEAPKLTTETFVPRGWTALQDAIGRTVARTGQRLAAMEEKDRPSKVIIVVMTDGQENASKEFRGTDGLAAVRKMVAHQMEKYSWCFLFLGANIDAITTSRTLGFGGGNAMQYGAVRGGAQKVMRATSAGVVGYRGMPKPMPCSNKGFVEAYIDPKLVKDATDSAKDANGSAKK